MFRFPRNAFVGVIIDPSTCALGATSIPGRPGSSVMSAFKSAQIAAMGQELQPSLGLWDFACPRETPEGEGTDPMPNPWGQTARFP